MPPPLPPVTVQQRVRTALPVVVLGLLAIGLICFLAERDVCIMLSCWMLGCCGCCSDFSHDELKFRRWQLLQEKEREMQGRAEEYQA